MTGMNILKPFAFIFFLLLLCSCRNPDFSEREVPPRTGSLCDFTENSLHRLTPPENLPGEGLKHTFIREKWRFSAFGQNAS